MGAFVFLNIDGADLHLTVGDLLLLHGQQHIGFILEPVALDMAEGFHRRPGDGPQTGLGIGELHAAENFEDSAGDVVAVPAAFRNMTQGKIPASQDHLSGPEHFQGAGQCVLRVVLIVPVYGDNAKTVGTVLEKPFEGCLQGSTLATVDLMVQYLYLRKGSSLLKVMQIFRLASVVDQNDMGKSCFQQPVDDRSQFFVRVQRGKNNADVRQILQNCSPHSMDISRLNKYSTFFRFLKVHSVKNLHKFVKNCKMKRKNTDSLTETL